jgi:hypothetical protein
MRAEKKYLVSGGRNPSQQERPRHPREFRDRDRCRRGRTPFPASPGRAPSTVSSRPATRASPPRCWACPMSTSGLTGPTAVVVGGGVAGGRRQDPQDLHRGEEEAHGEDGASWTASR